MELNFGMFLAVYSMMSPTMRIDGAGVGRGGEPLVERAAFVALDMGAGRPAQLAERDHGLREGSLDDDERGPGLAVFGCLRLLRRLGCLGRLRRLGKRRDWAES